MIRSLVVAALAAAFPASHCADLTVGDASRPDRHSQKYIEGLASAARTRFIAAANASGCREEINLFAFDVLRDKLPGAGQAILDDAAAKGLAEGRSVAVSDPSDESGGAACKSAIDKLRAADDRLLLLSERIPGG